LASSRARSGIAPISTVDGPHRQGYPRITPIWFLYEDGAFYMT